METCQQTETAGSVDELLTLTATSAYVNVAQSQLGRRSGWRVTVISDVMATGSLRENINKFNSIYRHHCIGLRTACQSRRCIH